LAAKNIVLILRAKITFEEFFFSFFRLKDRLAQPICPFSPAKAGKEMEKDLIPLKVSLSPSKTNNGHCETDGRTGVNLRRAGHSSHAEAGRPEGKFTPKKRFHKLKNAHF